MDEENPLNDLLGILAGFLSLSEDVRTSTRDYLVSSAYERDEDDITANGTGAVAGGAALASALYEILDRAGRGEEVSLMGILGPTIEILPEIVSHAANPREEYDIIH